MFSLFTIAALALMGIIIVLLTIVGIMREDWTNIVLAILMAGCISIGLINPTTASASDTPQWHLSTITSSYHYDRSHGYNESHNGILLGRDRWSVGHYRNSFNDSSWIVGYHAPINTWASWSFYGATGYDALAITPLIGINLHHSIFYVEITPAFAAFGLHIPLIEGP